MRGLLAAIPFVFPVFVAAQDSVGSVKDAPPRITPEMRAKTETIARALESLTPEGFTKKSLVERYTEANLYEKINGRSELFLRRHGPEPPLGCWSAKSAVGEPPGHDEPTNHVSTPGAWLLSP